MMMRHLLWKDGMTIKPLVAAILIGIVGIYALLMLATTSLDTRESANMFVSFWILMPNLVALGAPALLVGGEEENGTLSWLRSLPVSWQKVADSKFLVALGALLIAWIVSSLFMVATTSTLSISLNQVQGGGIHVLADKTSYADDVLRPTSILYLLFFSTLLLLCGFVTAYIFRSPIAGLIAIVPLISLINLFALDVGRFMLTGNFHDTGAIHQASLASYLWVIIAGAAFLAAVWVLQRSLARRRLTSPHSNGLKCYSAEDAVSAYRPPKMVGTTARPSPTRALLWQQSRQLAIPIVSLTLLVSVFINFAHVRSARGTIAFLHEIAPFVIAIGTSWIGGLAFYGDNVRSRRAFFADRGISATGICWTRLLFPVVCLLLLVAVALLAPLADSRQGPGILVLIAVAFGFGQLIGQWMQRPVLTFFAAPAYTAIGAASLFLLFEWYQSFYWTSFLTVPVLLYATWRLSGRWLSGRVDGRYRWRAVAYSALAIAVPFLAIFGARIWTTPDSMPSWRLRTLAIEVPEFDVHPNGRLVSKQNIMPDAFASSGSAPTFHRTPKELLVKELESDRIGEYVSMSEISNVLNYYPADRHELQQDAIAVSLKWSRQVRQRVLEGKSDLSDLDIAAEMPEARAVAALKRLANRHGPTPELKKLVNLIPNQQLRHDSRRVALLAEWQAFQRQSWRYEYANFVEYTKYFVQRPVAWRVAQLPLERTRAERYIDELTRLLLDQLDNGLPKFKESPGFRQRDLLWDEAHAPPDLNDPSPFPACRHWTADYENEIDRLRARFR